MRRRFAPPEPTGGPASGGPAEAALGGLSRRHLLALAAVGVTGAATTGMTAWPASAEPFGREPLAPGLAGRVTFGAWTPGRDLPAAHRSTERLLGVRLPIISWYDNWTEGWLPHLANSLVQLAGPRPPYQFMISWEPVGVPVADIAAGRWDRYIADFAAGAATYPGRVVLRPFAEMNLSSQQWSVDNPHGTATSGIDTWKRAWRRIATVMKAQRARNVSLMFCPCSLDEGRPMEAYWPGAAYVDALGIDGFNIGWRADGSPRLTPAGLVGPMYSRLCRLHPTAAVTLAEVASAPGPRKNAWYQALFTLRGYPRLREVVFFHDNKERDWRLDSDAATLAVCRRRVRHGTGSLPAPG